LTFDDLIWRTLFPILGAMDMVQVELRPARFSERLVAYLLDTVPFAVGAAASMWIWGPVLQRQVTPFVMKADGALWLAAAAVWQFLGNLGGATPGKRLMGLSVVRADGSVPGPASALARAAGWLLLSTPLANFGFWLALFHPRTRALHDIVAGTYVVETGRRRSTGALAFLIAASAAISLLAVQYWVNMVRPRPDDVFAVLKAENALWVISEIEEVYKQKHGSYTDSLDDLAEASGDPALFRSALLDVFRPSPFRIEAGNAGWRVTAAAKDRRNTLVTRRKTPAN
jgi:uncharacterized RDD family membrane protein YckC